MLAVILSVFAVPLFEYTDFSRQADKISAAPAKDRVVFTVVSSRGIGGATINLKGGVWPRDVVLLLTYERGEGFQNLENFRLSTDCISATGSLGSSGKVTFAFLNAKGGREPLEPGDSGGTLDIKVVQTEKGIELRLPPNMLNGSKFLTINWIDAYRR